MLCARVIKRDGRSVCFNPSKIEVAIKLAINDDSNKQSICDDVMPDILRIIDEKCHNDTIEVETIQDIIVSVLKEKGYKQLATSYTRYRNKRTNIRTSKSELMQKISAISETDSRKVDAKRENANIDGNTAMGTMLQYGSTTSRDYYLSNVIPKKYSDAHRNGDIHIHDLDFYSLTTTCTQIGTGKLLENGFYTGHGTIRTPSSIRTAASLVCIIIQSNQNDQHGGQSIPKFDYDLAPYVSKTFIAEICKYIESVSPDDIDEELEVFKSNLNGYHEEYDGRIMNDDGITVIRSMIENRFPYVDSKACIDKAMKYTNKETYQGMEAVIHNLNTMHSRAGAQTPFSSINYGTDTSVEGRMIIENILKALEAGLGNGEPPIFPIHIFKLKEGVNYNTTDPNYDLFKLACKVSAKRMFPNFSNIDAPYNHQFYKEGQPDTEIAYMGCVKWSETVKWRYEGVERETTIKELFDTFNTTTDNGIEDSNYLVGRCINVSDKVEIYDGVNGYVVCKNVIRNPNINNWLEITFSNGKILDCTEDHPLPIFDTDTGEWVRKHAFEFNVGDIVPTADGSNNGTITIMSIRHIDANEELKYSYDVETETDLFWMSGIISHNCRTRVISNVVDTDRQIVTGRGNLSFTSINLPRLGILANHDIDKFFELLDEKLELVTEQLLHRFECQCNKTIKNYPFLMGQGVWIDSDKLGLDDDLREVLKHGTLSIGFIGLAETLVALIGKHHGESKEAQELGLKIIGHMRDFTDRMSDKYTLNFSVLATPAEGLSGRFINMDKKMFGEIKGVTDRAYYTNSSHVPVYYPISITNKIDIEAPYNELENAGHICYVELDGDPSENLTAFEKIIRYMHDKGIGYGSINHPIDIDPVCGYTGIIYDTCPCCGRKEGEPISVELYKRIKCKGTMPNIDMNM